MKTLNSFPIYLLGLVLFAATPPETPAQSPQQLAKWLQRFPDADTNKDGTLTVEEAVAYRDKTRGNDNSSGGGAPRSFKVDPGWDEDKFPDHAVSYKSPEEIAAIYEKGEPGRGEVAPFDQPAGDVLRIVGTGHSFMAPGYKTLPRITEAAGFTQPLHTHTGGGMTGSARYKWEQENGIFEFDKTPTPKILNALANGEWDLMMWGPYFNDRPKYYACWIDFALKHNPEMKFYLSDAWPQLHQLDEMPTSEDVFTVELFDELGAEKNESYNGLINTLREEYGDIIFILPTSDAMTLAAQAYLRGELPGVEGLHKAVGNKDRSLWRDKLGHLGPGFERLEGYVFYATLYGKSPELIEGDIDFSGLEREAGEGYPSPELDRAFRKIAWQAVTNHPLSGITDTNNDGLADE
ncbi:MAG: hypothetical protein AAF591_06010 [Verrucomicrobiota bacterium]